MQITVTVCRQQSLSEADANADALRSKTRSFLTRAEYDTYLLGLRDGYNGYLVTHTKEEHST